MKKKKWLSIIVFISFVCTLCTVNAVAMTKESVHFRSTSVTIGSSFNVAFSAKAKKTIQQLGLKSYTLYTGSGSVVTSKSPEDYISGMTYSSTIDLSSYVKKGQTYYVTAVFYADGETKSTTSGKHTY